MHVADEFKGLSANSNGGSNKEHEAALIKMGILPEKEKLKMPDGLSYLFSLFKELRFSMVFDGEVMKLSPKKELSYTELKSYTEMTGFKLSGVEVGVLMDIDGIYSNAI